MTSYIVEPGPRTLANGRDSSTKPRGHFHLVMFTGFIFSRTQGAY